MIELLEEFGRGLAWPHAKYIGDEIFELRFDAIEGATRVLYFFYDGEKAVLTNGFIKKPIKLPGQRKRQPLTDARFTYRPITEASHERICC